MLFCIMMIDDSKDISKLEQLYNKYRISMFNVANAILHDAGLAEDAVHKSFIKIMNNLHKIDDIFSNKTRSLIVIIIRNTAIDIYRKRKRYGIVFLEDLKTELGDENILPDEIIIREETFELMKECLSKMNPNYSDVIILKYVHGYSNDEISEILGISNSNVRYRLHKGKKMLASILKERKGEFDELSKTEK